MGAIRHFDERSYGAALPPPPRHIAFALGPPERLLRAPPAALGAPSRIVPAVDFTAVAETPFAPAADVVDFTAAAETPVAETPVSRQVCPTLEHHHRRKCVCLMPLRKLQAACRLCLAA